MSFQVRVDGKIVFRCKNARPAGDMVRRLKQEGKNAEAWIKYNSVHQVKWF